MKKVILYPILCLMAMVLFAHRAEAQRFIGFVSAGANFAQIEGDDVHGFYKVGANAGPGLKLPVNRKQNLYLTVELLYAQKGSRKHCSPGYFDTVNYAPAMFEDVDRNIPFNPRVKCQIALDYVQVPVLFHYEDLRTGFSFGAGFSWSRLVRAKEIYNGFTRTTNVRSGTYKTNDWSVLADVDIRLYKNLSLGIRYEWSMVPIRKRQMGFVIDARDPYDPANIQWEDRKYRNHLVTARLTYYINEKFTKNYKTNHKGERMGTPWIREIPDYD